MGRKKTIPGSSPKTVGVRLSYEARLDMSAIAWADGREPAEIIRDLVDTYTARRRRDPKVKTARKHVLQYDKVW